MVALRHGSADSRRRQTSPAARYPRTMPDDPFTIAVHADADLADLPDVAPPIRPSTTFGPGGSYYYRRDSHETVRRLEAVLGALEGGIATVYPSGMAAIAAVLRHIRPRRVCLPQERYHGVYDHVQEESARGAWDVTSFDELGEGEQPGRDSVQGRRRCRMRRQSSMVSGRASESVSQGR